MGLFDFFRRGRGKPQAHAQLEHPFFGSIRYVGGDEWESGRVYFEPVCAEVEVSITAPATGPDEGHVAFVHEMASQWPAILRAGEPIARRTLQGWVEARERGELWPRLRLECLDVRAEMKPVQEWELTFWCEEAAHWLRFVMKGWTPTDAFVDG